MSSRVTSFPVSAKPPRPRIRKAEPFDRIDPILAISIRDRESFLGANTLLKPIGLKLKSLGIHDAKSCLGISHDETMKNLMSPPKNVRIELIGGPRAEGNRVLKGHWFEKTGAWSGRRGDPMLDLVRPESGNPRGRRLRGGKPSPRMHAREIHTTVGPVVCRRDLIPMVGEQGCQVLQS